MYEIFLYFTRLLAWILEEATAQWTIAARFIHKTAYQTAFTCMFILRL